MGDTEDQGQSLWKRIDDALRERNWNWSRLASEVPCARQYLVNVCKEGQCPEVHFLRICQILGWDPTNVMTLEWRDDDDGRASRTE